MSTDNSEIFSGKFRAQQLQDRIEFLLRRCSLHEVVYLWAVRRSTASADRVVRRTFRNRGPYRFQATVLFLKTAE